MIAFLCYEHWKFVIDSVKYHLYCHKIQIIGEINALNKYLILLNFFSPLVSKKSHHCIGLTCSQSYYSEGRSWRKETRSCCQAFQGLSHFLPKFLWSSKFVYMKPLKSWRMIDRWMQRIHRFGGLLEHRTLTHCVSYFSTARWVIKLLQGTSLRRFIWTSVARFHIETPTGR